MSSEAGWQRVAPRCRTSWRTRECRGCLDGEPDGQQRKPEIARNARQEPAVAGRGQRARGLRRAREDCGKAPAQRCARSVGKKVRDAGVARGNVHLQRFHGERQDGADADGYREQRVRRAPARDEPDEKSERDIGGAVGDDIVAHPTGRPGSEEEEGRAPDWRHPVGKGLQARKTIASP